MAVPAKRPATGEGDGLVARIREGLAALRLRHMEARLDELLADPQPDVSRLEWLWSLLEPQVRLRLEARIERRIKEARLPERKTLESFDFAFQPKLDRDLVLELHTLAFLESGKNVLLAGMSGTGKSHIAKALAVAACVANRRVRYTTSAELLATLTTSLVDDTLNEALKPYVRPELLVIDEVGLEQVERAVASRAGLLQKVLLPRYNDGRDGRSTIITSNIPWDNWGDYLGDHLGATALLDRLLHHSHVIVIDGPSWRDHVHRQETKQKDASSPPSSTSPAAVSSPATRKKPAKTKKRS